jgi:hypothetical protein
MIDIAEENESTKCTLTRDDILWDMGSQICTITEDLLPEKFLHNQPTVETLHASADSLESAEGFQRSHSRTARKFTGDFGDTNSLP